MIQENWTIVNVWINDVEYIIGGSKKRLPFNPFLHQLANYILYCEDDITYKERKQNQFEKFILHWDLENDGKENSCNYIYKRWFKNFLELTDDDIERYPELAEIQEFINYLKASKNPNLKGKRLKWIKDLKFNQLSILEGKIEFWKAYKEHSFPSTTEDIKINSISHEMEISSINNPFNLDLFKAENWKTVLKVLPFKNQVSANVDKLINIFNLCYSKCQFTPLQQQFIRIYQTGIEDSKNFDFRVVKNQDIANILNIDRFAVSRTVKIICKKLCKAYEELYIDDFYTYIAKGKYKTCSKCGSVKLIQRFYSNRNVCIECYNSTTEENESQIAL